MSNLLAVESSSSDGSDSLHVTTFLAKNLRAGLSMSVHLLIQVSPLACSNGRLLNWGLLLRCAQPCTVFVFLRLPTQIFVIPTESFVSLVDSDVGLDMFPSQTEIDSPGVCVLFDSRERCHTGGEKRKKRKRGGKEM